MNKTKGVYNMRKQILFTAALSSLLIAVACGNETDNEEASGEDQPLQVYTTLFAWESLASEIGGEYVEVENIVPPGSDAHSYEPTAQTMIDISDGDAFIYNGAGIDGFAESVEDTADGVEMIEVSEDMTLQGGSEASSSDSAEQGEAVDASYDVPQDVKLDGIAGHYHTGDDVILTAEAEEEGHWHWYARNYEEDEWRTVPDSDGNDYTGTATVNGQEIKAVLFDENDEPRIQSAPAEIVIDDHGDEDPHVWLDPVLASEGAEKITEELSALMPEHEEEFAANLEEVTNKLEDLDEQFTTLSEEADKHQFLVSHSGYGYWNQRYGIEQIGITGISPNEEPSQRQLQYIIKLAEDNGLNHVMLEQNISTKVAEVVQDETNAEALTIHNMESVMEDEQDEDYFSIMKKNIENLEIALNE